MNFNWIVIPLSALIPLLVGFIYYNKNVLGTAWMNASGMTEEKAKGANMAVMFGMTYVFSLMVAMALIAIVIHQAHLFSIVMNQPNAMDPTSEAGTMVKGFMDKYGNEFRTFKHGAFHGFLASIFLAMPVIGMNALYERRGGKYIFINWGFWAICMTLMGGVICQFA
jgi:hypothetical protein